LLPDFRALAEVVEAPTPFPDRLRNLQYRDAVLTKLPRALRYNDRASMRASCELREPFLDHRLFELALRQPADRKIRNSTGKWLLRQMAHDLLPADLVLAPKRAVQTPQREWLRGPLRDWATSCIDAALDAQGGTWLDPVAVNSAWQRFCAGDGDNSHHIWQWIGLGLTMQASPARA
jgi:asparagine synthase (glutamine-hydrolysing)